MRDIFQPRFEPARSIYEVFQSEAAKRKDRTVEMSVLAERDAVFREATTQAQKLGLRTLQIDEITDAERYASGSIDYGAKLAYGIVDAMRKTSV